MNPYGPSGFQNSSDFGRNFEFNASGTYKLGVENPTFSSSSSLSKPRMAKSRKSLNSKSKGSSETRKNDLGFNPFQLGVENVTGVSSKLDDNDNGGGGGGDGVSVNRSRHLKLKVTSKVEKVGNELIDEIRKLRVANESSNSSSQSADKLNDRNVNASKGVDNGLPSELSQELKKLNIGLSSGGLGVSGVSHGGSGGVNVDNGLPSELSQELKKMNIGSSSLGSGVSGVSHGGSGGVNVSGSSAIPLGAELPNDMRKLNLRDNGNVGGRNFAFCTPGNSDSLFGSSRTKIDSVVDSTLPENIKNLKLDDPDKGNATRKEMNVDTMVLGEMEKLKIGVNSEGSANNVNMNKSASLRKATHRGVDEEVCRTSSFSENVSLAGERDKDSTAWQAPELNKSSGVSGTSLSSKSSFPPSGFHSQPVRGNYHVSCSDETEKREGFSFTSKQEGTRMSSVEFKTPAQKDSLFNASNINLGFHSKKGSAKVPSSRGKKGKVKVPNPVIVSLVNNFSPMETSMQHEPSDSYSPMDISPGFEVQNDPQSDREPSLAADDAADEQLVTATQRMDINDFNHGEENVHVLKSSVNTDVDRTRDLDNDMRNEVKSKYEVEDSDQTQYFSASSSISSSGSSFKFAASSSSHGQASAAIRHQRKKNRMKVGQNISIPSSIDSFSDATSSLQFSPISNVSILSSQVGQNDGISNAPIKSGIGRKIASPTGGVADVCSLEETKRGINSPTAAARAAQEACEKWRLRGNQSYANGDLKKAEEYYTQGLSCIPEHETSRDCLRSLVLCYSNRAAARMSIGRMSEALQDCLVAMEIDPNFFRVQLRAANSYLALGEIGNASRHFKKLLQSTDVCVERKIILEASDGLQKAQKVSECLDRSTLFLRQKTFGDTESALKIIAEALVISPYSEQLLESKAEALFMLRRYEEVIQLCEETLEAAEKNFSIPGANELLSNMDAEILENYLFRTWRFGFIFKSNFYLGKLEEALEFLEKQETWNSMVAKFGTESLESLIPQLSTVRELVRHKSAGNRAFQKGRHAEAVEHYSAALSFNVESRPFAAVCFGNRAAAYQALGNITDAVADCSLAIALDANYLKAISRRATLFELIRDYDQAAKDLQMFVSLLTKQIEEKSNPQGASAPAGAVADLRQARQRLYQMEEQAKRGIPLNFYLILGVEASVTGTDLKKAYRKAALRHHPDKAGQSLARSESGDDGLWKEIADEVYKATEKLFKMIGEAYAVLSDPTTRTQYDIEEEMRNGTKKNMSKNPNDTSNYSEERGGVGRQWREGWRSSAGPYSRGFEPRPGRYY
ncbi:uncharacterized protein LOC141657812 [Silene latifolia]|uniref:uncharacterized protein LOC141657812 n=1 Tax=Silene latifolia TaxID=37657 RepID=UPI003D78839C